MNQILFYKYQWFGLFSGRIWQSTVFSLGWNRRIPSGKSGESKILQHSKFGRFINKNNFLRKKRSRPRFTDPFLFKIEYFCIDFKWVNYLNQSIFVKDLNVPISLCLKNHSTIFELHRDCQGCQIPKSDGSFSYKKRFIILN